MSLTTFPERKNKQKKKKREISCSLCEPWTGRRGFMWISGFQSVGKLMNRLQWWSGAEWFSALTLLTFSLSLSLQLWDLLYSLSLSTQGLSPSYRIGSLSILMPLVLSHIHCISFSLSLFLPGFSHSFSQLHCFSEPPCVSQSNAAPLSLSSCLST